jgi:hypothetical protein
LLHPASPLRLLVDTDDLTIAFSEGNTGRAAVAFTGVAAVSGRLRARETLNG